MAPLLGSRQNFGTGLDSQWLEIELAEREEITMAKPIELTPPLPHEEYLKLVERLKQEEDKPLSDYVQRIVDRIRKDPKVKE